MADGYAALLPEETTPTTVNIAIAAPHHSPAFTEPSRRFSWSFGAVQASLFVAYGFAVQYGEELFHPAARDGSGKMAVYPLYSDVAGLIVRTPAQTHNVQPTI
jgi:hypothetical protein